LEYFSICSWLPYRANAASNGTKLMATLLRRLQKR
jgi:hypothetical protein